MLLHFTAIKPILNGFFCTIKTSISRHSKRCNSAMSMLMIVLPWFVVHGSLPYSWMIFHESFVLLSLFLPFIYFIMFLDFCIAVSAIVWAKNRFIKNTICLVFQNSWEFPSDWTSSDIFKFLQPSTLTSLQIWLRKNTVIFQIWLCQIDTKPSFFAWTSYWRLKFPS